MSSIVEAPAVLENGNAAQNSKSTCLRVAFRALILVLILVSALVPIVFCLLHHKQGSCWAHGIVKQSSTESSGNMSWDWTFHHCEGIVEDQGQYLVIEQSGNYFIYAQLFRIKKCKEPFTLMLYKVPDIPLNNAVGHENGTVNFARPFDLHKGDRLYCRKNEGANNIVLRDQTYWGLFKM